ncbi:MAG: (2Fe-2S)-binding protein [Gammaproteobacteria bacterium]|nr:(2Fe-2S)-binding protein [Gammaproteobacteria bacterium]MBU0786326.1 (2Fe-2S)-binding protein [Gammaproteobacteria bacterium]MBU0814454.1 (2Fe-2S)-binding protein [Gammaproteobacteria bacterium]MBU1786703.1 (2Fe-2S)-binding protein [Gammaproteobacteria bacterium]
MIVCVCKRISDRDIARHAKAGLNFEDIQFETGVATQCGQCEGCARDVVTQCCPSHPVAALRRESNTGTISLSAAITGSKSWTTSLPLSQA